MSYVVIARKYRPQLFTGVAGQEHITRTLKNAIKLNKISHAYLFTGPRGIGKTTTARIFAKAVNCTQRKSEEPCNKCASCVEITNSESIDIIEIDAASNRGIDEIRKLRENIKFSPANAKYKVYIIDEVHMLTKEAFNAILKTLEEPPPHVIFIMATTEPEKVLDTITSRCQQFNFRLIPESIIMNNLKSIVEKEKIEYEEEGLRLIAKAGNGSMRDAQSIMDQAISYSDGRIVSGELNDLLGLIPVDVLFSYTQFIAEMDTGKALELTEDLLKKGHNLNHLFSELLMHFRNIMFAKVFGEATGFMGFSKEYSEKLAAASENFSKEKLVWITEFLALNASRMKYSENTHIVMDTILFKLCQKYVSFDEVVAALSGKGTDLDNLVKDEKPAAIVKEKTPVKESPLPVKEKTTEPSKGGRWEKIVSLIKQDSQPLYHSLKESKAKLKGKEIIITYEGNLDLTDRQQQILKNKIKEVMGDGYYPQILKDNKDTAVPVEESKPKNPKKALNPSKIEEDEPVVGEIVNLFGGRIEKE